MRRRLEHRGRPRRRERVRDVEQRTARAPVGPQPQLAAPPDEFTHVLEPAGDVEPVEGGADRVRRVTIDTVGQHHVHRTPWESV
jgi:hypothetical protein